MKKKVLLLVGLMLCLLLVGCGKSSDSPAKPISMVPDPNDYFSGAEITLVRNDEKGVYYMVEKYNEDDYGKYLDACTSSVFTNTTYSTNDDTGNINYINSADEKYRLEYTMDTRSGIINIICHLQEQK